MNFKPLPYSIIIRISKKEQKERKEKNGKLLLHSSYIWMTRNCQAGEIVAIGEKGAEYFPQMEVGDITIVHHFVEGSPNTHYLGSDDQNNYYTASFIYVPGIGNEVYGVYKGSHIVPNSDFTFLEETTINTGFKKNEGVVTFSNWQESRYDIEKKMGVLTAQVQNLSKTQMNEDVRKGILQKESEIEKLSNKINGKRVDYYKLCAIHPAVRKRISLMFDAQLNTGDDVCFLNIGCLTKVEFMGKEYIIGITKYFQCPANWAIRAAGLRSTN